MSTFNRNMKAEAAYDDENYGVHGVHFYFSVEKDNKAISWSLSTDWHLMSVDKNSWHTEIDPLRFGDTLEHRCRVTPFGRAYHSPVAFYEGQEAKPDCPFIKGPCYCDGTSLTSDLFDIFVTKGSDGLYAELEAIWARTFA